MRVAALFTRPSSVYGALGADCFDAARDARSFDLSCPVVAHPPCRAWGKLSHFSKPRADERDLSWFALWVVRHCGGVLEHPASSRLWKEAGIRAGERDAFGGLLVVVDQAAYGHRAQKRTGLYLVGCSLVPLVAWAAASHFVEKMGRAERERTPLALATALYLAAGSV